MATLQHTDRWGDTRTFTIVDEFPDGAIVWPIGRINFPFDGYIPVVWPLKDFQIDGSRLMTLKCKSEQNALAILREAVKRGVTKSKYHTLDI